MTFGHDKAIPLRPPWICRINLEDLAKIQSCKNVGRGQISAGMAKPRMVGHGHRADSNPIRLGGKPGGLPLGLAQFFESCFAHRCIHSPLPRRRPVLHPEKERLHTCRCSRNNQPHRSLIQQYNGLDSVVNIILTTAYLCRVSAPQSGDSEGRSHPLRELNEQEYPIGPGALNSYRAHNPLLDKKLMFSGS